MKIIFLGVGEAFDENFPNNAHLIISEKTNLLLDCGSTISSQLWKFNSNKDFLDAVYISHQHADHYFGLPALFVRMWEEKREKPITIICQKGFREVFEKMMNYAYPGFPEKFNFKIEFIEINKEDKIEFNDLKLNFAPTAHFERNLAVRVSDGKNSVCYSGDGMFNKETEGLYKDCDLLIHEAYLYDEKKIGHACMKDLIEMTEKNDVKCLALTHLNRDFRKNELPKIKDEIKSEKVKIIIPEPLEEYNF